MLYESLEKTYMSIILKFMSERLYSTSLLVYTFILLFVWQYVTYITAFKTVYTLRNSLYYMLCDILYHFKKASKYDQKIPQSHIADQPTAP